MTVPTLKKRKQTGTKQKQGSLCKRWTFTINNYVETDINRLEQTSKDIDQFTFFYVGCKYLGQYFLICARLVIRLYEVCEKGQTESLQLAETRHFYLQHKDVVEGLRPCQQFSSCAKFVDL